MDIETYVKDVTSKLKKRYRGIISDKQVENFIQEISKLDCSEEELVSMVESTKERVIDAYANYMRLNQPFVEEKKFALNDLFACTITNDVLHIHVVPVSVKEDIFKRGPTKFFSFVEQQLGDAFTKIGTLLNTSEFSNITEVYAVSNLFRKNRYRELFSSSGFDVELTDNEFLQERFGKKELYEAVISREKFLSLYGRGEYGDSMNDNIFNNDINTTDNNTNDVSTVDYSDDKELDAMFSSVNSGSQVVEKSGSTDVKSDQKVLVKTNNHFDDGGYGSVFGVVLVIISISFILAALFIQMLS